jgi:PTH1 family peptidyl-tRNA hydrolase
LKVVLGLGNPGPRYAGTRHNIGGAVVERLARRWRIDLAEGRDTHAGGQGNVAGTPVYLAVSRVFMNLSGQAVRGLWNRMGRRPENLIVVQDDIDLPLGAVRLKEGGGDGGHKGIRSVIEALGASGFARVRVGVGRPEEKGQVVDYVLERFGPAEAEAADAAAERAADAVEAVLAEGFTAAQARAHAPR